MFKIRQFDSKICDSIGTIGEPSGDHWGLEDIYGVHKRLEESPFAKPLRGRIVTCFAQARYLTFSSGPVLTFALHDN